VKEQIAVIEKEALSDIDKAGNAQELENVRIKYLSRKGAVSRLYKELVSVPAEQRPETGMAINRLKLLLEQCVEKQRKKINAGAHNAGESSIDVTMPGIVDSSGALHPITRTIEDICSIFSHMGFAIIEGPEIETEFNNFEALNIPLEHPSRDTFDTFYIDTDNFDKDITGRRLLRSHTSPVQIRYMQANKPPFAIAVPGKVFRPDATDASHSFMFHQIEGLVVACDISFAHLKWILYEFARQCFGADTKVRLRPHFFPFTEPSAEVDVSCIICQGRGCRVCSQSGWLEILGAGMVDPNVFSAVGVDSEKYSGLAFGMGVERIAMLKYGIDDIRLFFENDIRFLKQFA
jgi:phenylalanyl-tRNA synthetase alpha chain